MLFQLLLVVVGVLVSDPDHDAKNKADGGSDKVRRAQCSGSACRLHVRLIWMKSGIFEPRSRAIVFARLSTARPEVITCEAVSRRNRGSHSAERHVTARQGTVWVMDAAARWTRPVSSFRSSSSCRLLLAVVVVLSLSNSDRRIP